jgi:hypothetical protein
MFTGVKETKDMLAALGDVASIIFVMLGAMIVYVIGYIVLDSSEDK